MDYINELEKYLKKAYVNYNLPGLTVGIWAGEKAPPSISGFTFQQALGKTDIKTGEDLETEQFSHMASISKTFTACGILKLYEEGKLKLDTKLNELIPWIIFDDRRGEDITVFHLVTHTSGLPSVKNFHWTDPKIDSDALRNYALSDDVRKATFVANPGDNEFNYSDMGFEILGNVIQEISQSSYEDYIRETFLKPLQMNDSTMLVYERTPFGKKLDGDKATHDDILKSLNQDDLLKAGLVLPHTKDKDNHIIRLGYYPYNRCHAPSSTLNANIFDLKKWGDIHLAKNLFKSETTEKMWSVLTTVPNNGEGMGLGWFIRKQNNYTFYGHEGMDDGFRSSFWICPELDIQIIVLANISKAPVKKISRTLFDKLVI